jgi:hypothetical protein
MLGDARKPKHGEGGGSRWNRSYKLSSLLSSVFALLGVLTETREPLITDSGSSQESCNLLFQTSWKWLIHFGKVRLLQTLL